MATDDGGCFTVTNNQYELKLKRLQAAQAEAQGIAVEKEGAYNLTELKRSAVRMLSLFRAYNNVNRGLDQKFEQSSLVLYRACKSAELNGVIAPCAVIWKCVEKAAMTAFGVGMTTQDWSQYLGCLSLECDTATITNPLQEQQLCFAMLKEWQEICESSVTSK